MNPMRTTADRNLPSGTTSVRRRRRPVLPSSTVPTAARPPVTTVDLRPHANVQARVIAAIIAALGLLLMSTIGIRMLGSEPPRPEPIAVLPPAEILQIHEAKELERERALVKKLTAELDALRAVSHKSESDLKNKDDLLREKDGQLRERDESLRKAEKEVSAASKQLRDVKEELEDKDSKLREKTDTASSLQASLDKYEKDKRDLEQRNRELESKLARQTKPIPRRPTSIADGWPRFFEESLAFRDEAGKLKAILKDLEKERDIDLWVFKKSQAKNRLDALTEALDKLMGDRAAGDARFYLTDTLWPALLALKRPE